MHLVEIEVADYRGFYQSVRIAFSAPKGSPGSGLTVLVGPNNAGKSTVLDALRLACPRANVPPQVDLEHRHDEKALRITILNSAGEKRTISNPELGAVMAMTTGVPTSYPTLLDLRWVPSRRAWQPYTGAHRRPGSDYWNTIADTARNTADSELVPRLAGLSVDEKQKLDETLRELVPQLRSWKIEQSRGQAFVQYDAGNGTKHSSDLFGDGIASLFRVAVALFDAPPASVVVVDEPELSLHPQAQKLLAQKLSQLANDHQVIVATHSPYLVNWDDIANGATVYRLNQRATGIEAGHLTSGTISNLQGNIEDWQKPSLLDAVAREVFFADEVVFVEGQEDVGLIRNFIRQAGLPAVELFGYGAGGAGNIKYFLQMATELGIKSCAIFDGDQSAPKEEAQGTFPQAKIFLLPTPDIRDKPGRDERGRETKDIVKAGFFDRHGNIKAEYAENLKRVIMEVRAHFDKN